MSSDLLRRAAAKLREVVDHRAPGDWFPVITDSESDTGLAICNNHPVSDRGWACNDCWVVETYSEPLARYLAALHPPVALALADLFDAHARLWAASEDEARQAYARSELLDVARAVLREDGEQR